MSGDPRRAALDARALAWMREPWSSWRADDARFEALALDLFAFQFEHCAPYQRLCKRRGLTPSSVTDWRAIPAVPAGAFKEMALRSFPAELERHVFRTSGTSAERRGELHLDTLDLYEASLLRSFQRGVLPDLAAGSRARIRVLAPSPEEAPDSSLSHMFGVVLRQLGDSSSGFDVRGGSLQTSAAIAALEQAVADDVAIALCGTAFAFVHLLDVLAERGVRFALPAGSRAMETGGFKGRSREMPREALYAGIEAALAVAPARIVNQYGMTELGSNFYDSVLAEPTAPRRKLGPPWARARLVDPESGDDAQPGALGVVTIVDLANTGSVLAIQTADLGRAVENGFEVIGREAGAEARGCSIAADEMLAS